jgi:hypothetical protein
MTNVTAKTEVQDALKKAGIKLVDAAFWANSDAKDQQISTFLSELNRAGFKRVKGDGNEYHYLYNKDTVFVSISYRIGRGYQAILNIKY